MHAKHYKETSRERLLRDLQQANNLGINGIRRLVQKYLPVEFRRALSGRVPEFFMLYYLGFRLPQHQINWIKLYLSFKYLLELAPRDHGKSWIFSYGLPLWEIYASFVHSNLKSADARILQISKTDDQAYKFAAQVRETIEKNVYLLEDFGDIRDLSVWLKGHFRCKRDTMDSLEKDYTYEKVGVLGAITGGHFHRVNVDDMLDDENTKTTDRMDTVENWWWGTIWNLREIYTKYAVVGTRKNRRDLYNTLLESPTWTSNVEKAIIKYPMIPDPDKPGMMKNGWLYVTTRKRHIAHPAELKPEEKITDVELLTDDYVVLWPPLESIDNDGKRLLDPESGKPRMFGWGIKELLLDRAAQGSTFFDREKQNLISAEEGAVFQKDWFQYFSNDQIFFNDIDQHYYLVGT